MDVPLLSEETGMRGTPLRESLSGVFLPQPSGSSAPNDGMSPRHPSLFCVSHRWSWRLLRPPSVWTSSVSSASHCKCLIKGSNEKLLQYKQAAAIWPEAKTSDFIFSIFRWFLSQRKSLGVGISKLLLAVLRLNNSCHTKMNTSRCKHCFKIATRTAKFRSKGRELLINAFFKTQKCQKCWVCFLTPNVLLQVDSHAGERRLFPTDRQGKGPVHIGFDSSILFYKNDASPGWVWSRVCADKDAVVTLLKLASLSSLVFMTWWFSTLLLCFCALALLAASWMKLQLEGHVTGPSWLADCLRATVQSEGKQEVTVSEPCNLIWKCPFDHGKQG